MMLRNRLERGEGRLGCLFGLVLLLAAILIAYKMIPVKVKAAELRDTVQDEAKSAGTHTDKQITETIVAKAQQEGLPVTKENIDIVRNNNNTIIVDVKYTVPIAFPGYTYNWNFHHRAENPIF